MAPSSVPARAEAAPYVTLVAGETSGDLLAGLLLDGFKARWPGLRSAGIGGQHMTQRGFEAWWSSDKLAVRGYVEVLRHYREIVGIREQLKKRFPNVSNIETDLTAVFDTFKNVTEESTNDKKNLNLSLANSRARLRMTTLYYFAGIEGLLVAGTGNKIEDFGVGFYTKYGDGGVDLSPIADLMKSEVFALAKYLEAPDSIQNAAPTDGLFGDDRTDEDQLGASYDELEWAMLENEAGKDANEFSGRQATVFEIYKRLNKANQHKMNPIPVCKINRA